MLWIGCFFSVCVCILFGVICYFESYYLNVKIIFYEENSMVIIDLLQDGSIDVGFVFFLVNGMYCVFIYWDKFIVVVFENYFLVVNSIVMVEELMDELFIVSKGCYELSIMVLFKEKGIELIFKYEFNYFDIVLNFICQGLGIVLLLELILKVMIGKLCFVVLEFIFY